MPRRRIEEDERVVSRAMRELAEGAAATGPVPDPSFIWWKAQLLRRFRPSRTPELVAPGE